MKRSKEESIKTMRLNNIADEKNIISHRTSAAIYILKAVAIFSVITAHVNIIDDSYMCRYIISGLWGAFSKVGVIAFFISSGFFYKRKEKDTVSFWKKKLVSLVVPWIVCSVMTYTVSLLLSGNRDLTGYLKWFVGYNTWYWYIAILIIILAAFKYLWKNVFYLCICIVLTLTSLGLYTLDIEWYTRLFPTPYLNFFNWIGFFAIGIICRKYRIDVIVLRKSIFILNLVLCLIGVSVILYMQSYTYFNIFTGIFECVTVGVLYVVCYNLTKIQYISKIMLFLGETSYCIYLLHMQIVQFICNRLADNIIIIFFKPIIGIIVMGVLVYISKYLCSKIKYGEIVMKLVGIR